VSVKCVSNLCVGHQKKRKKKYADHDIQLLMKSGFKNALNVIWQTGTDIQTPFNEAVRSNICILGNDLVTNQVVLPKAVGSPQCITV
jgi:hypothetical protein